MLGNRRLTTTSPPLLCHPLSFACLLLPGCNHSPFPTHLFFSPTLSLFVFLPFPATILSFIHAVMHGSIFHCLLSSSPFFPSKQSTFSSCPCFPSPFLAQKKIWHWHPPSKSHRRRLQLQLLCKKSANALPLKELYQKNGTSRSRRGGTSDAHNLNKPLEDISEREEIGIVQDIRLSDPRFDQFQGRDFFLIPYLQNLSLDLRTIAWNHSQRIFCSILIVSSPSEPESKKDMAIFRWLGNMGSVYGASLMYLVGLGYWIQGFRCFPWFAVSFYMKDVLTMDPGTLQIVQNTVNIPMVAKPVYGIFSDSIYIRGAHRVPYLVIGGFLQALSWATIAFMPSDNSSVTMIAVLLALSNMGASMVDVVNDALVAECGKKEKTSGELQSFAWFSTAAGGVFGNLIAAFSLSRVEFRMMFGIFGVLLLCQAGKSMGVNEKSFGLKMPNLAANDVEQLNDDFASEFSCYSPNRSVRNLLPSSLNGSDTHFQYSLKPQLVNSDGRKHASRTVMPSEFICAIESSESTDVMRYSEFTNHVKSDFFSMNTMKSKIVEEKLTKGFGLREQFTDLVYLVKQPKILYPLSWFMASYAMIPTLAGTMFFFQTQHLKIDPSVIGLAKVMGQVGLMGGTAVYSRYLKGMPLRKLLASTQVLLCFCMMFDILLVKRVNVEMGIPDEVLVMGASAFVDAINQFKILPFMVLLAQLCPAGSEGSLLSAFMSMQCLATIVSGYMGVTLASMLHISANDFSELPTGIFMQSIAALLPLLWISLIPDEESEINSLQRSSKKHVKIPHRR